MIFALSFFSIINCLPQPSVASSTADVCLSVIYLVLMAYGFCFVLHKMVLIVLNRHHESWDLVAKMCGVCGFCLYLFFMTLQFQLPSKVMQEDSDSLAAACSACPRVFFCSSPNWLQLLLNEKSHRNEAASEVVRQAVIDPTCLSVLSIRHYNAETPAYV